MPTYQYLCTECGDRLEVQQSFSDDALTVCPACRGRLRKVFNAVGVVFKGSGFYMTDNRSKATTKTSSAESATPAASSTASTTESKPAAKTAANTKRSGAGSAA